MGTVHFTSGYKYQLTKDATLSGLHLPVDGPRESRFLALGPSSITLKAGYASDGPSGPAIDTASFMRGAFFHDGLYQAIRVMWLPPETREYADKLLRQICLADGMNPIRAWWVYHGVRLGGGPAADPKNRKRVRVVP